MDIDIDPERVSAEAGVVAEIERAARRHETPCGEGALVWREWGEGPPVVLLHGGSGSWTHWLRVIPDLARDHRVLAPDLPGSGDSAPLPEPHTVEHVAEIVSTGIDRLIPPAERYFLVGFSYGSLTGGFMLAYQGPRIRRFVLVGAAGLGKLDPVRDRLKRWRREPDRAQRLKLHAHNLGELMLADPAAIDALAIHLQEANAERGGVSGPRAPGQVTLLERMEGTNVPLAGIWGERDALSAHYLDQREHHLKRFDPDAEFVVVPNAGHWVQHEAADEVIASLRRIFARDAAEA